MHAAEVEVAFGWDVGYVGWYALLFAQFPYLCAGGGVVHGCKDHGDVRVGEIVGCEVLVMVCNLLLLYAISYFGVQAAGGADAVDGCVGVEEVEDATGCYLWMGSLLLHVLK